VENKMTKQYEVIGTNIKGELYDFNENYMWIATAEDIFVVKADQVTEVVEVATYENELEKFLVENDISFDCYTDAADRSYMIEGGTYTIDCYCDFEYDQYSIETLHNGFEREEDKWSNKKTYKKLSTLIKNVEKYINK
jgi:hypothetical protein